MFLLCEGENMNQPDNQPLANYVTLGTYEAMLLAAENGDPEAQRSVGLCFETRLQPSQKCFNPITIASLSAATKKIPLFSSK